jgi:hypothetical protein
MRIITSNGKEKITNIQQRIKLLEVKSGDAFGKFLIFRQVHSFYERWKDRCTEIEDQAVITAVLRVLLDPTA